MSAGGSRRGRERERERLAGWRLEREREVSTDKLRLIPSPPVLASNKTGECFESEAVEVGGLEVEEEAEASG